MRYNSLKTIQKHESNINNYIYNNYTKEHNQTI